MEYTVNRNGEKFYVGDVTIFDSGATEIERTIAVIGERGIWTDTTGRGGWLPTNLKLIRRGTMVIEDGDAWTTP